MNKLTRNQVLAAMDIDIWVPRAEEKSREKSDEQLLQPYHKEMYLQQDSDIKTLTQEDVSTLNASKFKNEADEWEALKKEVATCTRCPLLHKTRIKTVFGIGNIHADLMFIGEAPGAQEDKQGEPFVGRAGQLLDAMLHSIGLSRQQIYIANILKSRPPNNRDPLPEEVAACTPFLLRQIDLIQPKLLVALGRIAAQFLLNTTTPLGSLRGKTFNYGQSKIPLLVMYHPAYLLRSPQNKSKAYEDLCLVKTKLEALSG